MKKPSSLKETLAATAAKRDVDIALKREVEVDTIPGAQSSKSSSKAEALPKVTLYAHADVLKAIRLVAVEDGVQAQVILRRAVQEYLEKRGHRFTDLTAGT